MSRVRFTDRLLMHIMHLRLKILLRLHNLDKNDMRVWARFLDVYMRLSKLIHDHEVLNSADNHND